MHILITFLLIISAALFSDEGMWMFDSIPTDLLKNKYNFNFDSEWAGRLKMSTVRLSSGCSGSFVSDKGLILTNHHCIQSCIEEISDSKNNYMKKYFYADIHSKEAKCKKLIIEQLLHFEDVTQRVLKSENIDKKEMARIENECSQGSDDIRCEVIPLYGGTLYYLFKYKQFKDVRLVFAPEFSIAFLGGSDYNFQFPRYNYNIGFLRVYNINKPVVIEHYLKWDISELHENSLSFVSGFPGESDRLLSLAELEFIRDIHLLKMLFYYSELKGVLLEFQNESDENRRIALKNMFYLDNALKVIKGLIVSLQNNKVFIKKREEEKQLEVDSRIKKAYRKISEAKQRYKKVYDAYNLIEKGDAFYSVLYKVAKSLIRYKTELSKEEYKRLNEYRNSRLSFIRQKILNPDLINDKLEITTLAFSLTQLRDYLGSNNDDVKTIIGDKTPLEMAKFLVSGTKLKNIEFRKALFNGDKKLLESFKDPMLEFALKIDPIGRKIRKYYEDEIECIIGDSTRVIYEKKQKIWKKAMYHDANSTLRFSYGQVKGYYSEQKVYLKPFTTLSSVFDTSFFSSKLTESWILARDSIDKTQISNFCTTNDIVLGNSGSPIINDKEKIIGVVFDGNVHLLSGYYGSLPTSGRAVAVSSSSIIHILDKVYKAQGLLDEINYKEKNYEN